jgi:hypothetical protein
MRERPVGRHLARGTARTPARAGHHVFASMRHTTTTNAKAAEALRAWVEDVEPKGRLRRPLS